MPNRGLFAGWSGRKPVIPPQGCFSPEARVGSLTAVVTRLAEEWSSKGRKTPDRTRLTGHPRNPACDTVPDGTGGCVFAQRENW